MIGFRIPSSNPLKAVLEKSSTRSVLYWSLLVLRVVEIRFILLKRRLPRFMFVIAPDSSPNKTHLPSTDNS
jgi:hypothetical protein